MTVESIRDISWWCDNICTSSKNILIPTVDIVLETDISHKGCGGCQINSGSGKKTSGNWSYEEKLHQINNLLFFSLLKHFVAHQKIHMFKLDWTTWWLCITSTTWAEEFQNSIC